MTALTATACSALLDRAAVDCGAPENLGVLVVAADAGQTLVDSPDVALVSATGSERMGAAVAPRVAARFGKVLMELGGNNAAVVAPSADLELAARGITFAAAGTAGQRCTTMRRLIVHEDVADALIDRLADIFAGLRIGDPLAEGTLVGPLINGTSYEAMRTALDQAVADGGEIIVGGGRRDAGDYGNAHYVEPAIVRMPAQTDIVCSETFAPILYALTYREFADAEALHNGVPQGLSSSIFTSTSARRSASSPPTARIAASSTSTSAPRAPRSAAPSAARRRPAAGGNPARTRGGRTCAAPPTPSTTPTSCRSLRE